MAFLLGAFSELQLDLEKLRWLEGFNAEAVARIFDKLDRCGQADITRVSRYRAWWQGFQSRWEARLVTDLEKMGGIIDSIHDGLALPGRTNGRSLFFTRVFGQRSYPQISPDAVRKALERADAGLVIQQLASANTKFDLTESGYPGLVRSLLLFSVVSLPTQYEALLTLVPSSEQVTIHRDLFRWHIITIDRRRKLNSSSKTKDVHREGLDPGDYDIPRATQTIVLRALEAPLMKDRSGRLLLHYAASYGLLPICREILTALGEASTNPGAVVRAMQSADHDGLVPLQLAVMENHTSAATYLVDTPSWEGSTTRNSSYGPCQGNAPDLMFPTLPEDGLRYSLRVRMATMTLLRSS